MEQWNAQQTKQSFKIEKIYMQDSNSFTAIISGKGKRNYSGIDNNLDKIFYTGLFFSDKATDQISEFIYKYKILLVEPRGSYSFWMLIGNDERNIYSGMLCATATDVLTDFLELIINNKQLSHARKTEIEKVVKLVRKLS